MFDLVRSRHREIQIASRAVILIGTIGRREAIA